MFLYKLLFVACHTYVRNAIVHLTSLYNDA